MYRNPLKLTVIGVLMLAVVPIAQAITFLISKILQPAEANGQVAVRWSRRR